VIGDQVERIHRSAQQSLTGRWPLPWFGVRCSSFTAYRSLFVASSRRSQVTARAGQINVKSGSSKWSTRF